MQGSGGGGNKNNYTNVSLRLSINIHQYIDTYYALYLFLHCRIERIEVLDERELLEQLYSHYCLVWAYQDRANIGLQDISLHWFWRWEILDTLTLVYISAGALFSLTDKVRNVNTNVHIIVFVCCPDLWGLKCGYLCWNMDTGVDIRDSAWENQVFFHFFFFLEN